jgi:hypothetical protein
MPANRQSLSDRLDMRATLGIYVDVDARFDPVLVWQRGPSSASIR